MKSTMSATILIQSMVGHSEGVNIIEKGLQGKKMRYITNGLEI